MEIQEVREAISNPPKKVKEYLSNSVGAEKKLSLHTTFDDSKPVGYSEFITFVGSLLPDDKKRVFINLLKFPVDTTKVVKEIFKSLYKIFNAQNPVIRIPENFNYDRENWIKEAWSNYISSPSSIMVVDMPEVSDDVRAEPYYYFLNISSVNTIDLEDGRIKYIGFKNNKEQTVFICDEFYRIFEEDKLVSEIKHYFEYCPAKFLIEKNVNNKNPLSKANAISDLVAKLDWLLFRIVSGKHAELYIPYPIYWGYEQDCDYLQGDMYCDGGYLRKDGGFLQSSSGLVKCPKCGDRIAGVGSFIDVPITAENINPPPVGFVPADINAFNALMENIKESEIQIYSAATGSYIESINNQAVNEKQILSLYESRKATLEEVKTDFEGSEMWLIKTLYKASNKSEVDVQVNYGTRFYLTTVEESVDNYANGKESGIDPMLLDELQDEMFSVKHKNDHQKIQRYKIIKNIDPLRHLTFEETLKLLEKGVISKETAYFHLNLSALLTEVERENPNVFDLKNNISFEKRVNDIKMIMMEKAKLHIEGVADTRIGINIDEINKTLQNGE